MGPEARPMKTNLTTMKESTVRRVIVFVIAAAAMFVPLGSASAHSPCAPGETFTEDGHMCFSEQSDCDSGDATENGVDPGTPLFGVGNAADGVLFRGSACVNLGGSTVVYVGGSGGADGPCGEAWLGDTKVQDTDTTDNNANACP